MLIKQIYNTLLKTYGHQGWWPIIDNDTLLCEYHVNAPKNGSEALEICLGSLLTQGTQWFPNVVRSLQQLKLGRPFTKQELEVIRQLEITQGTMLRNKQKRTKSTILTQNTNWKNAEKAIVQLNKKHLINIKKIMKIDNKKLALIIKSSGYHNQKAKKLKNFCSFLLNNYNGSIEKLFKSSIEKLRNELLSINGIGPETADSIILYAAKKPIFVIDAYTKRIINRVGFKEDVYEELQKLFMDNLDLNEKLFNEYHALLVELGKNICKKKPLCDKCQINKMCNHYNNMVLKQES